MDNNEQKSLNQIIEFRIQKREGLFKNKINPYPYNFSKENTISDLLENENILSDKKLSIAGRIISLRNMYPKIIPNIGMIYETCE